MEKNIKEANVPPDSFDIVGLVDSERVNHLIGKLLTIIEVLGLPAEQGKAAKDAIRDSAWEWKASLPQRKKKWMFPTAQFQDIEREELKKIPWIE